MKRNITKVEMDLVQMKFKYECFKRAIQQTNRLINKKKMKRKKKSNFKRNAKLDENFKTTYQR